jgi:excisionase family DNA binding protein
MTVPAPAQPGPASVPQVMYRIPQVMKMLGLSRSVIFEQLRTGRLRSVRQGRTRLVPADAVDDYVDLLKREAAAERGESGTDDDAL